MLRWISIFGGLLIMMGHHARSEALFYYFRLEDQVPENLSLIKTWCTRRMNELPTVCGGMFRYDFGHDLVAPTRHRLGYQCLPFARGSHPRKPGPPPATLDFARKATSPATQCSAKVVLDRVAKALGWLEKAADSGYTQNSGTERTHNIVTSSSHFGTETFRFW